MSEVPTSGEFEAVRATNGNTFTAYTSQVKVAINTDLQVNAEDILLAAGLEAGYGNGNTARIPLIKVWPADEIDFGDGLSRPQVLGEGTLMTPVNGQWKLWSDVKKDIIQSLKPGRATIAVKKDNRC